MCLPTIYTSCVDTNSIKTETLNFLQTIFNRTQVVIEQGLLSKSVENPERNHRIEL